MKLYTTLIRAKDPNDGEMKTWSGPYVPGISFEDAEAYCQRNGLGYCKVYGVLISVVPTKKDGITPNWKKEKYYNNNFEMN